jgi:RimJ/RimL family protein N-acetyltransferase
MRTERLLMREWAETDREPFAAMNADPEVMRHFPAPLTRAESDALLDRIVGGFAQWGFGLWALETLDTAELVGFTGLSVPRFRADWMADLEEPVVEVGWRLARSAWGQGLATEAARRALRVGFEVHGLPQVVSFTTTGNVRSQAVMLRLGMTRWATYDHPVAGGSLPSVVHLLTAADWRAARPR